MNADSIIYWVLIIVFLVLFYRLWHDDSDFWEHFNSENFDGDEETDLKLSKEDMRILKDLTNGYKKGLVTLPGLRITSDLVVDGMTRCKRNLTAREINSIRVSGNVVDGATVKGEIVKDNENLLVKRGQRLRVTDGAGMYQLWTIEKE